MKPSDFYVKAMELLIPEAGWRVTNDIINLSECPTNVTETQIIEKANELFALEPMRLLRQERNRRIAETDWRFRSDLTPSQEWIDYSQALRDLPSTATPKLDDNGQLTNVTWPTKPE